MSYTQLTQGERSPIQYRSRHCTVTEIAKQLNRHKSTISREIRRHRTQGQQYSAEKAQRQSRTIKQRKRQPYKLDSQLIQHIDTLIRRKLSPEQVCAYLCKHHQITLHHSTIYRYLRQDKSNGSTLWQHLRICSKPYRKRYGQHMDQRQSTQPCRHRKPTRYRRPEIPYRRLGSRHHCRQRTEKRIIDLGRTRYPLHHHLQIG
ncbi:transposase%2C IS30 family [Neisseria meningitidis]|nr:transposase%2C IS30 family [Neisseria meningitidis]